MSQATDYLNSTQCAAPAIRTNIDTVGLLTECDAIVPSDADLESFFKTDAGKFRLLAVPFKYAWEAKACRVKQNNMADFIEASMVDMSAKLGTDNEDGILKIRPFIQVKRTGPMNNNYWIGQGGQLTDATGTPDAAGSYWTMSMSSPTGIPLHANWFIPLEFVFVEGMDNAGNMIKWAGKIVKSVVNGTTDITVTMFPQMTNSSLTSVRKANPVHGSVTRGVGNIDLFQSFCEQPPGLIDGQLDIFWVGWTRNTFKISSHYLDWLKMITGNGGNQLYTDVFHLDIAAYNKQVAEDFRKKEVESFMWGTAAPGQAKSTYDLDYNGTSTGGLEKIMTGADAVGGDVCVGRKAQPVGIYEQFNACQRVVDAQGAPLNLPSLIQSITLMQRMRQAVDSPQASQTVFEVGMPQSYFPIFQAGMFALYKNQWGALADQVRLNMDFNKAKVAPMGWLYYDFPLQLPVGCVLRVVLDPYFDDRASHLANVATVTGVAGYANLANRLWIVDWSGIKKYILASETLSSNPGSDISAMQRVGVLNACRMRTPSMDIKMRAWLWTAYLNCPKTGLIIENVSSDIPTLITGDAMDNYDTNSIA